MSLINPKLAAILVCPVDHGSLTEHEDASTLVCDSCGRTYPVQNGIPIMLVPDAEEGS